MIVSRRRHIVGSTAVSAHARVYAVSAGVEVVLGLF